jgi:Phosphatidylinositol-specific phospholipase C, X domain
MPEDFAAFAALQGQTDVTPRAVTLEEFETYLMSEKENPAVVWPAEDLDHPLNCYFISSSHNTYLTSGQLHGSSTTEGYIATLTQGCRSVEIDIWDGESGGEPKVVHGYASRGEGNAGIRW